jgi:hypothetical protein
MIDLMMKRRRTCPLAGIFFYLLLAMMSIPPARAVDMTGFDLSNQMEFSWDTEKDEETLENWWDVNYHLTPLTTGLRFEAFQPAKSGQRKEGVSFIYFAVEKDDIQLRAGDFYAIFGRGLALRAYEDRDLRIDNKLTGIKLQGYYKGIEATLLGGRPPRKDRDNADEVRGADLNVQPAAGLTYGWSYVALESPGVVGPGTELTTLRADMHAKALSFYAEMAKRTGRLGYGLYLSSSLALPGFALTAEFKDYDRIALRTGDGLDYNTPPALTREHTYSLFRRHPHTLDADDETGIQVEANLRPLEHTTMLINYSYAADHEEGTVLPASPELFGEWGRALFREAYLEVAQDLGEKFSLVVAGGKSRLVESTHHTAVLDLSYYLDPLTAVRFELQGQHTEEHGEWDDHLLTVEVSRAPRFSASLVGERTNKSDLQKLSDEDNQWLFAQLDYQLTENHDATLFFGSRQGGFICTGGRCRWEPEFRGIELKLLSNF